MAMSSRTYAQNCGLARAMDVLGERWTVLVVRELTLGPRRYGDLVDALPGIGTNMLAARLKSLEAAGVVRRATLPPPASVNVYELTDRGEELRPILRQLGLWGYDLAPYDPQRATRASWALLSMVTRADPQAVTELDALVELRVDAEVLWVSSAAAGPDVRLGHAPTPPDLTITCDGATFGAIAVGQLSPIAALREGRLAIEGDRRLLTRFFGVYRLPPVAPAAVSAGGRATTRG
jgi:DNA-binding HxlR family transcriptional regulator